MKKSGYCKYLLLTLAIVALDQITKWLVHSHLAVGEEINVWGSWFRIHYVLNEGIAFGLKSSWAYSKMWLTLLRLIASIAGVYIIVQYASKKIHPGVIWSVSLILAGTIGNTIDNLFYGIWLDNTPVGAPFGLFNGQVIDMLYFPLFQFTWPAWIPRVGETEFHFFNAIFNVADASIFIGALTLFVFQKKFFVTQKQPNPDELGSPKSLSEMSLENTLYGSEDDCCLPS